MRIDVQQILPLLILLELWIRIVWWHWDQRESWSFDCDIKSRKEWKQWISIDGFHQQLKKKNLPMGNSTSITIDLLVVWRPLACKSFLIRSKSTWKNSSSWLLAGNDPSWRRRKIHSTKWLIDFDDSTWFCCWKIPLTSESVNGVSIIDRNGVSEW